MWASLRALNRLDTLLLFAPGLAFQFRRLGRQTRRRGWLFGIAFLVFLPLVVWEIFLLLYFGSWVPNTAFAKLQTGIPPSALALQGLRYLAYSWIKDPLTPAIILAGWISVWWRRDRRAYLRVRLTRKPC